MVKLKCDICHKEFLGHDDREQFIVCDDCQSVNNELTNGKGDERNEQQSVG
ncbi:hypothetical protein AGMMS49975_08780 [Clostridia bacterium]|nr:hypothetical protein AGMMS49975_08780 [Clostridia bacterium]